MTPIRPLDRSQLPPVYGIVDAGVLGWDAIADGVLTMDRAGISWIQIRAKEVGDAQLCEQMEQCIRGLGGSRTWLWMNDRPDLAALFGVAGIHVGQDDLAPGLVRGIVGEDCWIGRSTHNLDQLGEADEDPDVDLIALGPIFATRSKKNPDPEVGLELLGEARRRTSKPLVAIGGISGDLVEQVLDAGADSAVLLGALCQGDLTANCERLVGALAHRYK